jgi:hypothetical protein
MVLVAGCSADMSVYPSLAPRSIERGGAAADSAGAGAVVPAAPDADLAAIQASAQAASADFGVKLAESRSKIEAGANATIGSEAWVSAQQAYSVVESARGSIGSALADLDKLHQEAVAKGDSARMERVQATIAAVSALDAEASAKLD